MLKAARHSAPDPQRFDGDKICWKPPQNGKGTVLCRLWGGEICCSALNGPWIIMENLGWTCSQSAFFKTNNTTKKWKQENRLHITASTSTTFCLCSTEKQVSCIHMELLGGKWNVETLAAVQVMLYFVFKRDQHKQHQERIKFCTTAMFQVKYT